MQHEPNPVLVHMEELLKNSPDSALAIFENLYKENYFDKHDKAHYYILLTEARNKKNISLMESDSLIDFSIKNLNERNDPKLLSRAYLMKGRIWKELNEPQEAIQTYRKGIDLINQKNKNPEILSKLYDDLGNIYLYENLYSEAMETFLKEYETDKESANNRGLTFSLRNIGSTYDYLDKKDSAYYYYTEALKYAKLSEDSIYLSDIIHNDISIWYKNEDKYQEALAELQKINIIKDNHKLSKGILFFYFNELDSARQLLKETTQSTDLYIRTASNRYLCNLESKNNDFETALQYFKKYHDQSDSIRQLNKVVEIKIIDHKNNTEITTNQLNTQHNQKIILLAFSFILIVLFLIFYFSDQKKKKKIEHEIQEREIANLRTKIALTEKEIIQLHNDKKVDIQTLNEKMKEKEEELVNSQQEIEFKIFITREIYHKIKRLNPQQTKGLSNKDHEELFLEIDRIFVEYNKQLKQEYPGIKPEEIVIFCLQKSGFSSTIIGLCLNVDGSTIRHRIKELKEKKGKNNIS